MHVRAMDHIVLRVADVERSLSWYCDLVGLEGVRIDQWRNRDVFFPSVRVSADTIIDLQQSVPDGVNMDHLCLVVDRDDIDAIQRDERFEVVDGPDHRFGARGDGWSIYVRDPDGNTVEFRSYS